MSQVWMVKDTILVTRFNKNLRTVFLNSHAFKIVFDDSDPNIGETIMVYHLNGVVEALSACNASSPFFTRKSRVHDLAFILDIS